ncbi:MAG: PqqD family protein [Elainella sp.]
MSKDVLFRQVENEAILLHLVDGMYYSLNETSIPFWEALRSQTCLTSAVDQVTSQYDVEPDQVIQDLRKLLEELLLYNLITPLDPPQSP